MCARTLRSSRVQDTRGSGFARGIGGEILRGAGDHGDADAAAGVAENVRAAPDSTGHTWFDTGLPGEFRHLLIPRSPSSSATSVKTNNSERFVIGARIEKSPGQHT